jgi:leucyl-tRNA synthetase
MNCGGKEHKSVHFPVFVMNHVALLPEEHWPKGIFVNWWIVGEVGKLSKSKGGAESLADAVQKYTADGIRLYYCHIGSPKVDITWDPEAVFAYRRRIELIYDTVIKLIAELGLPRKGKKRMTAWLRSVLGARIARVRDSMETYDLRDASNVIFYEMYNDLKRYLDSGGFGSELKEFIRSWVLLASPFAPHMSEELWHRMGETSFASMEGYPQPKEVDPLPIYQEKYIDALRGDLNKILKLYKGERSRVEIFVAEDWKRKLVKEAVADPQRFLNVGQAIKSTLSSGAVPKGQEARAAEFVKTLQRYVTSLSSDEKAMLEKMDELSLLGEVRPDLESEFSCRVVVHTPEETSKNPHAKAAASKPLKPGLLIA